MKLGPALLLAGRALAGRRMEDGRKSRRYLRGAVAGVALSIVPLVVVLVVADGMIQGITARYIEAGTYHLQASPFLEQSPEALRSAAASLSALPGVKAAFPELQGPGVILKGTRTAGTLLRAVDPAFLEETGTAAYLHAVEGESRLAASGNEILLGEALARSLHVHVGDLVSVITSGRDPSREGTAVLPKVSPYRVRGIVSAGYRELDALWAFINLRSGARILLSDGTRSFIGVKTRNAFSGLGAIQSASQDLLGPEWSVSDWQHIEVNLFQSFRTTRALLLLVMALAVCVAAINVGSALIMLVLERRRDIAILKSAGADSASIGFVFLLAGLATGGLGTLLGLSLGALLAWRVNDLIRGMEFLVNSIADLGAWLSRGTPPQPIRLLDPGYYLERIPVHLHPSELALVLLASLFVCLLASLLPARRAARLPPLEIFRKT